MIPLSELSGITYGVAELADLAELAALLAVAFSEQDVLAVANGVTAVEFEAVVRLNFPKTATDGLTIVARSADTGEMAGALLTEDSSSPAPDGFDRVSPKFAPTFDFLHQLDAEYRQGQIVAPGDWLHLILLGVPRLWSGRGIGRQLVAACLENGARKGFRRAVTEATGSASQHIFRQHGFAARVRRSYRDYRFRGEAVFAGIQAPEGTVFMDKSLQ